MIVSNLSRSKLSVEFSNNNSHITIKNVSRYRFFGHLLQRLNLASSIRFADSKGKVKTVFINTNSLIKRIICLNQDPLPTKKALSKKVAHIRKNSGRKLKKLDEPSIKALFNKIVLQPAVAAHSPKAATVVTAVSRGKAIQGTLPSPAPTTTVKMAHDAQRKTESTDLPVKGQLPPSSSTTTDLISVKSPMTGNTAEITPQETTDPSTSKCQYQGPRDENGLPSGKGKLLTPDGERLIYEGDFVAGKYEGEGTYFYKNGNRYFGQVANNQRHGTGSLFDPKNNLLYSGGFENDKKHGSGYQYEGSKCFKVVHELGVLKEQKSLFIRKQVTNFVLPNQNQYYGELIDGLPDGEGGVEYNDKGTIYKGEWKKGKYDGEGILTNPDGSHFCGEFENGLVHGRAKWTSRSREYYTGQYEFGQRHGKGFWWSPKGDQYEGDFKHDKFDGKGVYTFNSGNVFEGTFSNGFKVAGEMRFKKGDIYQGGYNDTQKKHGKGHSFIKKKNQWYAVEHDNGILIRKSEITKLPEPDEVT